MSDEITGSDDVCVLGIHPGGPGVHVADLDIARSESAEHSSDIVDLAGQGGCVRFGAVQVFAADADGNDPVRPMLLDCLHQSGLLGFEVGLVFRPDTNEQGGAGSDGGGDGVGEGVTIGRGEETSGREVAGKGLKG